MRRLWGAALVGVCAIAIACGTLVGSSDNEVSKDAGTTAADASSSADGGGDAHADAGVGDAGLESGVDAGPACDGGTLLCPNTQACVASCSGCSGFPIECFACGTDAKNPIGTCQPDSPSAFCLNGDYSKAYLGGPATHCNCNNTDPTNCPGKSQVCIHVGSTDWCLTCGEAQSDGRTCKANGSCGASSRTCD